MLIGIDASRAVTRQRTGTEAYALYLLRSLLPLAENRHQVRLYFNQKPPDGLFPEFPHVEHCVISMPRLWSQIRLARELSQRPPDIFFTPAHVIPFTYRGSSVATIHDLGFHYFPNTHTKRQLAYLKLSTKLNGRSSSRLIADSQATKADIVQFYNIAPAKIDVVYPGINPLISRVSDVTEVETAQRRYGIESPYLLYIGTLQPRKNLARLIEAHASSGLTYQLVLAGKLGWNASSIVDQIKKLDAVQRQRVLLPGFINEADKAALISGAGALLYPSLYEGFGFPLLEGQACGTPVLASNASSLPEIAGDGALLVDPHKSAEISEGMQRIVNDNDLRAFLIEKGLANVISYTWTRTAAAVLQTLEQAATMVTNRDI